MAPAARFYFTVTYTLKFISSVMLTSFFHVILINLALFIALRKTPPKFGLLSIIYRELLLPFIERDNPDIEGMALL